MGAWLLGHKKIKQARGVLIYGQQICSANVQLRLPRPKRTRQGAPHSQGQVGRWASAMGGGKREVVGGRG